MPSLIRKGDGGEIGKVFDHIRPGTAVGPSLARVEFAVAVRVTARNVGVPLQSNR